MNKIEKLEQEITEANIHYRKGEAIISDEQYDILIEELKLLDPSNDILLEIGINIDDSRKTKLPIIMASMNKIKDFDEFLKWVRLKNIPNDIEMVLTPKYDGISLCVEESKDKAWSRGDGILGQSSDEHLTLVNRTRISNEDKLYSYGELIMSRQIFSDIYSEEYSNPRNLVAGQINHKTPNIILEHCDYISYGMVSDTIKFDTKSEELDFLNKSQKNKVPYQVIRVKDITNDILYSLFEKWNKEYEIDGVIIEINSMGLRNSMGRETSTNNPAWARAFKGEFEEVKETVVTGITWQISKNGLLKPVIQVEPVELDGAIVSNVTGNNARFMRDMGIGIDTCLGIKRSGMVIPKIVSIKNATGFNMPIIEGVDIGWNENNVELMTLSVTTEQRIKQMISFFNILEVDELGPGIISEFYNAGFDTTKKILQMTKDDMLTIDRFGERKANNVINAINKRREVSLSKLQHASGMFINLGSKKLVLLEDLYNTNISKEELKKEIITRDGFSEISANSYLDSIDEYREFEKSLEGLITVKLTERKESVSNDLEGMVFVFTGVRDKEINEIIESRGGKMSSGVSKNSTHLITKEKGSGSSKEKKAIELGQTIWSIGELRDFINNI